MQMWPLAVPLAMGLARDSVCLLAGLRAQLMTWPDRVSVRARAKGTALMVKVVGLGPRRQLQGWEIVLKQGDRANK